jgi:hypothetical protein
MVKALAAIAPSYAIARLEAESRPFAVIDVISVLRGFERRREERKNAKDAENREAIGMEWIGSARFVLQVLHDRCQLVRLSVQA